MAARLSVRFELPWRPDIVAAAKTFDHKTLSVRLSESAGSRQTRSTREDMNSVS